MSNEQSKVVTKVIDVRHKAPDQAIHELMQAAKDGFAVTKIATRFNHTHVYLETSTRQVSKTDDTAKEEVVEKEEVKADTVKPVAKKTASKSVASTKATATPKKEEPKAPEQESSE